MEPIWKKSAAAAFGLLLVMIISCNLQFHKNPSILLIGSWQRSWQLFQSQVTKLSWQDDSVSILNPKDQNRFSQGLRKFEERSRRDIFGKEMADVFRRRVEQVEHACHGKTTMEPFGERIVNRSIIEQRLF